MWKNVDCFEHDHCLTSHQSWREAFDDCKNRNWYSSVYSWSQSVSSGCSETAILLFTMTVQESVFFFYFNLKLVTSCSGLDFQFYRCSLSNNSGIIKPVILQSTLYLTLTWGKWRHSCSHVAVNSSQVRCWTIPWAITLMQCDFFYIYAAVFQNSNNNMRC